MKLFPRRREREHSRLGAPPGTLLHGETQQHVRYEPFPLTFIAGIYGMNFTHMPELSLPWAYPPLYGWNDCKPEGDVLPL